jgi:peptidoglycan/LPS O-acetylase OafA/YrhL
MNQATPPSRQLRTDIQALRGFAVLIVLFYHAKISFFSAGYLGVDIFFVISGFLITRMIKDGIESGSFRFSDFYFRRAKRLLPAAYVTFLVTALLAPLFLASSELQDFRAQMAGAVTFTANIVLWRQSGYFEGAAELKPLLHVWSLAIEEQYYFLLPAMLVLIPRRFWLWGAVAIFLASLVLCLIMVQTKAAATFYLLPTRAWELTIGSVGALMISGDRLSRVLKFAFWPALAVLVVLPFAQPGSYHPGPDALLICLATLVLILRKHPVLFKGPAMRALSKVGDISYSLYLVHWPLFAFFNNAWISDPANEQPLVIRLGLIALSLLLAYLLNRYVEEPVRRMEVRHTVRVLARAVVTSLGLVMVTNGIAHPVEGTKDYAHIRRANHGFGIACEFEKDFAPIPECRNSDKPEVLFWGDSFAMHLVPGILESAGGAPPIVQATRSACGPLRGIARVNEKAGYNPAWAESCIAFNESVVRYLKKADSVKTVVLSSPLKQYVNKTERLLIWDVRDGSYRIVDASLTEAVKSLKRTVDTVRALGKRVVVVAPPPSGGFDIGRCIERLENRLLTVGGSDECNIDMSAYRVERGKVLELLAALPQQADVEVIRFDSYLCDSKACRTQIDGTFIYRDGGHLSHEGSIFMANAVSLVEKINQEAR